MKAFKHVIILIAMLFFQHCTEPVDFDQIDNAIVKPAYVTTLIHLNLAVSDFLNEMNEEITSLTDEVEITIGDGLEDYIDKVEFTFISENSFDRSFRVSFVFLDEFNEPIYTLKPTITVPENSFELTTILEIPEEDIYIISETSYIEATIELLPSNDGSAVQVSETASLNIKSAMKLYVNFTKT